jgi:hypothetical protein
MLSSNQSGMLRATTTPVSFTHQHVLVTDSLMAYEQSQRAAGMNINTDYLAMRYRLRGKLSLVRTWIMFQNSASRSISILGVRLTSQYDECIWYHINGYRLKRYMQEWKDWDEHTLNMIDLSSFGQHFKRLTPSEQTSLIKLVHDQLPLGKR